MRRMASFQVLERGGYKPEPSHYWQAYSVALILMTSMLAVSVWAVHGAVG